MQCSFHAASPTCSELMQPVVTDVACSVVCVSVCVGHMGMMCNDAELIESPFGGGQTNVSPRNHVLDEDPD